jgi:hypothetical protein
MAPLARQMSVIGSRRLLAVLILCACGSLVASGAQNAQRQEQAGLRRPPRGGMGSTSSVASAAVVAGWFTSGGDTNATLDLLVLWRGTPGWPLKSTSSGGSGGGGGGSRRGMTVNQGGLSLYAAFDGNSRTAQIEEQTVRLGDNNVVLVDDVDGPRGPRVLKVLRVDPSLPDPRRIDAVIAKSQELRTYMRCDAQLPDARQQALIDVLCSRYVSK